MSVYQTKEFARFARKAGLSARSLLAAAEDVKCCALRRRKSEKPKTQVNCSNSWMRMMATKKTTKRSIRVQPRKHSVLATVHKTASGLHAAGAIDKATMREFDALCLTPVEPMKPHEIRALRTRERVSQPVFARYLNVRRDAVSKWERGEKKPDGPSLKLLNLVKAKGLESIA